MSGFSFNSIFTLLPMGLILLLLYVVKERLLQPPSLPYPYLDQSSFKTKTVRLYLHNGPKWLFITAWLAVLIALFDPRLVTSFPFKQHTTPGQPSGVAIYLILDRSGSMQEQISDPFDLQKKIDKLSLLKRVSEDFIRGNPKQGLEGRASDMIGLVAFSRGAQVLSPLTLDHTQLLQILSDLQFISKEDQDGTAIGYAIYKGVSLVESARYFSKKRSEEGKSADLIKNAILILITDGLQETNPLDVNKELRSMSIEDAARFAKENKVKLYIIHIGKEVDSEQFAPHRRQMTKAAEVTGGRFFNISQQMGLAEIYKEIDRLEKNQWGPHSINEIKDKEITFFYYLYPLLVGLAFFALLVAVLLECCYLKEVP